VTKLVLNPFGPILRARLPLREDDFSQALNWRGLEFTLTPETNFTMAWTSLLPDLSQKDAEDFLGLVGARYPISKDYSELKNLAPDLVVHVEAQEWVFYGGSFHPWHQGHQACIDLLPEDKLCFILPDRNPHKDYRELDPVATFLEISALGKFSENHYLVPTFLLEAKTNPTVNWIERMKDAHPEIGPSLLMGFDNFSTLKSWTRSEDLLRMLKTVYVVSRLEDDEDRRLALDEAHALAPELDVVFLGKHDFEAESSSEIRKKRET
jgi:nicotinic acid mononucleotide adenylyltransferase